MPSFNVAEFKEKTKHLHCILVGWSLKIKSPVEEGIEMVDEVIGDEVFPAAAFIKLYKQKYKNI